MDHHMTYLLRRILASLKVGGRFAYAPAWYDTGWSHDDGCSVLPDDGRAASNRHGTVRA